MTTTERRAIEADLRGMEADGPELRWSYWEAVVAMATYTVVAVAICASVQFYETAIAACLVGALGILGLTVFHACVERAAARAKRSAVRVLRD